MATLFDQIAEQLIQLMERYPSVIKHLNDFSAVNRTQMVTAISAYIITLHYNRMLSLSAHISGKEDKELKLPLRSLDEILAIMPYPPCDTRYPCREETPVGQLPKTEFENLFIQLDQILSSIAKHEDEFFNISKDFPLSTLVLVSQAAHIAGTSSILGNDIPFTARAYYNALGYCPDIWNTFSTTGSFRTWKMWSLRILWAKGFINTPTPSIEPEKWAHAAAPPKTNEPCPAPLSFTKQPYLMWTAASPAQTPKLPPNKGCTIL